MSDKRNFLDRLLRRTEKIIPKKDKQGKIVGQTFFQYDQSGEIIAKTDSVLDENTNRMRMVKKKTWEKNQNGEYDPYETLYFDDKERPITERVYSRDKSGMLSCEQRKFVYVRGKDILTSFQENTYDGGAWTTRHLEENELDPEGHIIRESIFDYSRSLGKLVCTKEKTYQKNQEGEYDPKETIYRDISDRITKEKEYHREQTPFDKKSVLIGEEKVYGYNSKGEREIVSEDKRYRVGGLFWDSMDKLAEQRFQTRLEKLALVHVTKYLPKQENGHWVISSTAQATDFRIPRNRVHFTIGHHVASHNNGSWDDAGVMVVAPLKGALELNGKPLGMSSVDTFFETSPDHKMILPVGTRIFIPAKSESELNGALSKNDGDITYYKTRHFTDKEKRKIFNYFSESYREGDDYTHKMRVLIGNDIIEVAEKDINTMSDEVCLAQSKRMMLEEHLKKNGYFTESDWEFSKYETDHQGCGLVAKTGEKLGCRWSDTGNKLDFNTDFFLNNDTIVQYYNKMQAMDFIAHFDEYQITGVREIYDGCKEYQFQGPHYVASFVDFEDQSLQDGVARLKKGLDISAAEKELTQNSDQYDPKQNPGKESDCWSPAFMATYALWHQNMIQDLKEYNALAKDFDFENWQNRVKQKIADYETTKTTSEKTIVAPKRQNER